MGFRSVGVAAIVLVAGTGLAFAQGTTAASAKRGEAIVKTNCAECHATGLKGDSPNAKAPPFRTLGQRYKIDDLQEALAEGIVVGHGTEAGRVATHCAQLILSDGAPSVREKLESRYSAIENIIIQSPEETAEWPDGTIDLAIINSLLQYLSRDETAALMRRLHGKLKPGGRLITGDVIDPATGPLTDAAALLKFVAQGEFLVAALGGLVRTAFSDYRKVRGRLGLTTWTEGEFIALLREAGFEPKRLAVNFGHNQARMAFEGWKRG